MLGRRGKLVLLAVRPYLGTRAGISSAARDLVRAPRRAGRPPEGGLGALQGFDDPGERKFPAFRTLEVEQVAAADLRRQGVSGVAPESGLKIAVRHACNDGAAGSAVQTINSHPKDKKNS